MEELIRNMVRAMVDSLDEVLVKRIGNNSFLIYEVQVAQNDTGQVIGKHGRNVQALRSIVNAVSHKNCQRCLIEIIE